MNRGSICQAVTAGLAASAFVVGIVAYTLHQKVLVRHVIKYGKSRSLLYLR